MYKESFGTTKKGEAVTVYTLTNGKGMEARVTDFGATLVSLCVLDKDGQQQDVVLGYDNVTGYENNSCYFGATIGRNGNRIAGAKVTIEGTDYELEKNDHGNNLHSGSNCVSFLVWDVKEYEDAKLTLACTSKDGEQGFPGNMDISVTYQLTGDNALEISYHAVSDKETVANFTNHTYFNLAGHNSGNIEGQELKLYASDYTPVKDNELIPTGEVASVENTPLDFRNWKRIGKEIQADFDQLNYAGGYDHNYVLEKSSQGAYELMAEAYAPQTGIALKAYTDLPGVQFYAGNFVGEQDGKQGAKYGKRQGFCLESQSFPNAVNDEHFSSPLLKAGEVYETKTGYQFGIR